LNNSKIKIGIICPLVDEYNACKEILSLKNESELSGRIFSERKEMRQSSPQGGRDKKRVNFYLNR
jgi:hypothetical protein